MFPRLSYIEWIVDRLGDATHDLGSSDLSPVADDGGVVPAALRDLPDPGSATLEELVAAEYGVGVENVLVTAGATHANFLVAAAAMGRSEAETPHVLVEKPGYEPLLATPRGLGARVNRFVRPTRHYYELEPGRVESAMTEDTALITATNGHNPSGRAADRDALAEIGRVAAGNDAMLLVDEVYAPLVARPGEGVAGDDERAPFGGITGAMLPNTVVTGSLTKFHGLGGLDIGWLVAAEPFVERARSVFYHLPTVADPSRALARRALANAETLADRSRDLAAENHALLAEFVEGRDDLSGLVAPGSTFAFPSHERADGDAVAGAAWEAGILVVPGRFFDDPDRFRLSLGGPPDAARAGLDALGAVLDDL